MNVKWTNDWEQRKLGDVFEQTSNLVNPKEDEIELWSLTVEDGLTKKSDRYNREFLVKKDDIFKEVRPGDIVYNPMNMTLGAVGYNGMEKSVAVSGYYTTMVTKDNYDSYYINTWLKSPQAILLYRTYATGSLIEKQRVQFSTLSIIPVAFPRYEEQAKIGRYFQSLDHLITLHQWKCYFYEIIRLNDWEQRKFSDFTWKAGKRNKEDLDLEPYAITNEHGFIRQCDAHDDFGYMKDTDRKAYNIVQPNSFAYNPARINVGSIGYYKGSENVIVSSLYEVFQTDDYVDDRFLWHWFKSDEFPRWIERLQEGSVRLYFYYDKLSECQLPMPSLEEQKKVAVFLDSIDHLITLHQRKYILYKNIKSDTEKQRKLCESEEKPKAKTLILA